MSSSLFKVTSPLTRRAPGNIVGVPANHFTRRSVPRLAFAPAGTAPGGDVLVVIFQRGGMDGLSALIPYGEGAKYYDVRRSIAVPEPGTTNGALGIGTQTGIAFGLHPSLAPFKDLYDAGHLAVIAATGCVDPTRSHFDAMRFMEAATPGNKTVATGWLGRHLESVASTNTSPFRAVGFGSLVQASLRGTGLVTALALESIAGFHLEGEYELLAAYRAELETLYSTAAPSTLLDTQARAVFETIDLLETLNGTNYTPANGVTYANDELGQQLQQVAQLVKAQVGLEVACVDVGGWDTHETQGTNDGYFRDQLASFANAINALYTDLGDAMSRVTIVTMSEFGRRVEENASHGTDHGHGNTMFVMGGGVNGGQIYGTWPGLDPETQLNDGDLAITTDQRDILAELVSKRLGNSANLATVFPGYSATFKGIFK